jgi:formiminoglutamase
MTNPTITQSQKRFSESIGAQFHPQDGKLPFLFLTSSTDTGVIRNGGRNGARFAPQSFLSTFKKFASTPRTSSFTFNVREVAHEMEERSDFDKAQRSESSRIGKALEEFPSAAFCHLGGGHDHIYPLLLALGKRFEEILVINIDAHADTRTDHEAHSGTPFRQFAGSFPGKFRLFQIGLHPFANSVSTLSEMSCAHSEILWRRELNQIRIKDLFGKIASSMNPRTGVVFSLDADALSGHEVPGVSAVNPLGLNGEELRVLWEHYKALPLTHAPMMGIYELNPLYDTLASLSMRSLGSFVVEGL